MDKNQIAHMETLGRKWLPAPPEGWRLPAAAHLFQLGIVGYSLYSDEFAGLLNRATAPPGTTVGQRTMNLEGSAIQQEWLASNSPTYFVPPDLEASCSDPRSLAAVRTEDLKRRQKFCLYALQPDLWFFAALAEAGEEFAFSVGGKREVITSKERSLTLLTYDQGGTLTALSRLFRPGESLLDRIEAMPEDRSLQQVEEYGTRLLVLACNLQLIQQSYPDYAQPIGTRCGFRRAGQAAEQPKVYRFGSRAKPLKQTVLEHPSAVGEETGRHQRPHFRPGHWRRQPHGERFAQVNPEVEQMRFPDGRTYHMKWIDLYAVNFPEGGGSGSERTSP